MSNNDPDNDVDVEDFDEGGFDDFSKKGTFGDLWRNNPMVKIGTILAGLAVIVGAIILFGGKKEKSAISSTVSGAQVNQAPGTEEVSKTMQEAIEEKNIQNAEEALRTSGSAMPIPVEPPKGTLPIPVEETSGEDPLDRWRRMQEERARQQEALKPAIPVQQAPDTKTPAVNAMAQSMSGQMQTILQGQKIDPPQFKKITGVEFVENKQREKQKKLEAEATKILQNQGALTGDDVENILIPAGTIEYGQLLLEANTDAPGPVMAQILSGPLKGSRVLGSFTSTDQYITLNFNSIIIDGLDYPVQGVAIDPDTTLPGLVTEIDNRYLKRVILPMAAAFVEGLSAAISESDSTTITVNGSSTTQTTTSNQDSGQKVASGIEEAGEKLGEILDEEADKTKPLLRLASGTPIGILFVAPVTDGASVVKQQ